MLIENNILILMKIFFEVDGCVGDNYNGMENIF